MMPRYYEDKGIIIYHADYRDILPNLPRYDHIISDPPYDEKTHAGAKSNTVSKQQPKGTRGSNIQMGFTAMERDDSPAGLVKVCQAERWHLVFCALEMLGEYKAAAGPDRWIRSGVWDRDDTGTPQISGDRPAQGAEGIAIWHPKGQKVWNGGGKRAIWRHGIVMGTARVHPTQKPIGLMLQLIAEFTKPGDIIVDTHMGSGTTLVAAKQIGRRAVGIETQKIWCDEAIRRLRQESLFGIEEQVALL